MKRVYISGPMTGYPFKNRVKFNQAEDALRLAGYDPINPSSNGLSDDASYDEHMRADLRMLLEADMVATLPGCEQSRGSGIETRLATSLGMPVHPLEWYVNPKARLCSCPWCRDGEDGGAV
ncbi:DUF4406 domain-containing protein [Schaalia cardiffensis]|uniref:DUF4406 domain-containing protein n=1 Tax=Schaalia cardiffensis TaxID=181487 RepID=UPI0023F16E6F|nr:DUF4406 domain-containing protein [Schaalia cardiffensis]